MPVRCCRRLSALPTATGGRWRWRVRRGDRWRGRRGDWRRGRRGDRRWCRCPAAYCRAICRWRRPALPRWRPAVSWRRRRALRRGWRTAVGWGRCTALRRGWRRIDLVTGPPISSVMILLGVVRNRRIVLGCRGRRIPVRTGGRRIWITPPHIFIVSGRASGVRDRRQDHDRQKQATGCACHGSFSLVRPQHTPATLPRPVPERRPFPGRAPCHGRHDRRRGAGRPKPAL